LALWLSDYKAIAAINWLRGLDLNQRPSGYEPDEVETLSSLPVAGCWVDDGLLPKSQRESAQRLALWLSDYKAIAAINWLCVGQAGKNVQMIIVFLQ
jgi:hypothetical protein